MSSSSLDSIGVAVIGAGMAGRSHAAAYRMVNTVFGAGLPPVRLVAIADANTELAEDGARRYGYETALPGWEAVVDDPSVDAVSIVVGNALHRQIAEALVAAGKHVLCEKPLAGSLDDARAMAKLESSTDLVTAVGYTHRRSPAVAAIRDHVAAGELGELTGLHARYWCDYACNPRAPLTWRFLGGMGSGALGDVGAHILDLAEYLCGPISSVAGGALAVRIPERPLPLGPVVGHEIGPVSSETGAVENEDSATFTARFASGLAATFSVSRTAFGLPNGLAFDLTGLAGRAAFDLQRPAEYLFDDAAPDARTRGPRQVIVGPQAPYFHGGYPMESPGVGIGTQEEFVYQARAFLDQVAGIPDPLPPNASFAEGLRSLEIIDAVVRSTQSDGAAVPVPPA